MKYRVSSEMALKSQRFLRSVLPEDRHNGQDGYLVRSLYFDSIYNDDLEEKMEGLEDRKKIRLRIYSPKDQVAKLELKSKYGEWQEKHSLRLTKDKAIRLVNCDYSVLRGIDHPLARELYFTMFKGVYRPQVMVQYHRYAFMIDTNDIRITFDRNLVSSESDFDLFSEQIGFYPVGFPDDVTLEVKYNHFLFSYIKDLLNNIDKSPLSYSKYVMARFISHIPE